MEKYLAQQTCVDFTVSSAEYFRHSHNTETVITEEQIAQVRANTSQSLSGSRYKVTRPSAG